MMKSDIEIRQEGFQVLFANMDFIDAEKFIALMRRDRFDYTKWRENLFENMSVEELIEKGRKFAVDFRKIKGNLAD
ncbi:MAG: hypothetical protein R2941_04570 [Desulfobacterales bacterium]